jgi:hypothetical protein
MLLNNIASGKGRLGMRPWELCLSLKVATCPMIWTRTPKAPAWTGMWAVYPNWTRSACPSRSKRILVSGYCARRVGLGPEPEHRANTTTPGNGRTATASSERRPFQAPRACDLAEPIASENLPRACESRCSRGPQQRPALGNPALPSTATLTVKVIAAIVMRAAMRGSWVRLHDDGRWHIMVCESCCIRIETETQRRRQIWKPIAAVPRRWPRLAQIESGTTPTEQETVLRCAARWGLKRAGVSRACTVLPSRLQGRGARGA